ncbi:MAG: penicillin acylase family protein [Haloarculaceae archaeon]
MDREQTRRAVLAAVLGGGVLGAAATPARSYLDRFAPGSGSVWDTVADDLPGTVETPHGPAELAYDDHHVAHLTADSEAALSFATGYAHGADRLFQLDLQRRQMRGQLSAVVGEATLPSDRFHVQMDFAGAAAACRDLLEDTEAGRLLEAYADGINRHLDGPLPQEFDLLGYEPAPWTPEDTLLAAVQISWGLTGSFRTLRKATVAAELGPAAADSLLPDRLDHDATILNHGAASTGTGGAGTATAARERPVDPALTEWLSAFESPPGIGSNSWLVSGEHTRSGAPILANDPHLTLMAPPVWYEQHVRGPKTHARGVTFPGIPFVIIGRNEAGAWGFTNAGADCIDFYTYDTRGGEYRYGDAYRAFDDETRTIAVADGPDRDVTVRKTVHGPVLGAESDGDRFRSQVGVAWTGLTATRTAAAVLELCRSDGLADARDALRTFDLPTQNCVYADRDGNTLYRVTGKVPIRRTDGEPVPGNQVFDGSAKEGEWAGFTPYGESSWEGFIPYEEMPHVVNPGYVGTANQRIVDDADYPHYFAEAYAEPFRGIRLWDRLDARVASDEPVTPAFVRDLQRDTDDERAAMFVPTMRDARDAIEGDAADLLDELDGWDYRMDRDSRAALVFARFVHHYRDVVFRPRLERHLDDRRDPSEYYGNDWVLLRLPADSAWFEDDRDAAIADALDRTASELDSEGWETFGDYNRTAIDHPFDRAWLNYPRYPTDGSEATLNNFRKAESVGSSWRQIVPLAAEAGPAQGAFPGGNDGSPFSAHYSDQLRAWADGEYKPIPLSAPDRTDVRFREGGR